MNINLREKYDRDYLLKLIPPSCLGIKCVYRTRVVSSPMLALQLLVSTELTVSRLRSIERIDAKTGKKLPVLLRRAVLLSLEYIPSGKVYQVVSSILSPLPRKLKEYISKRFEEVASSPLSYIERKRGILASKMSTGWKVVANPLESLDTFIIPKKYMWYTIEYLTSVGANFKPEIAFCNEKECYPLPLGLFPTKLLTGLAYETGHIDPINELEQKYGGANMAVIITKMYDDIKGTAIAIHPKKRKSKVVFFIKVDNPRETALKLATMQIDALEIEDELLKRVLGEGYDDMLLDKDIDRIIEEELEEEIEFY